MQRNANTTIHAARNAAIGAALSAALIAGLAGSANAQFIAEGAAEPAPERQAADRKETGEQTIVVVDGGKKTELRIVNGVVDSARVDGEEWPKDRVERRGARVVLLDADGETVRTFELAEPPPAPEAIALWTGRRDAPDAPPAPRVMLGITYSEPGEGLRVHLGLGDKPAMQIDSVIEGLPAAKAGLKRYDLIVSIAGSDGASGEILRRTLADAEPGDTLELTVRRAGETRTVRAELDAYSPVRLGLPIPPAPARIRAFRENDPELSRIEERIESLTREYAQNPADQSVLDQIQELTAERAKRIARTMQEQARGLAQGITQEIEREHAIDLERLQDETLERIERAMRNAERQMLELREGRVFIRSAEEVEERLEDLRRGLAERAPAVRTEIEERVRRMEERMERVERTLDERLDRLTSLVERMADRLEQGDAAGDEARSQKKNP